MIAFLFTKTPLLFFVQSLWRDEAFTYLLAKQNIINILITTAKDFNPPLYYLIIHFWIKFFGSSEISLRTVSFIFFWLTIYVLYMILRDICNIPFKKILIYLFLAVINPLLLYYAFEARMYTMLAFFATLSSYAFLKKRKSLFLISTVLGLYTHYFMIFVSIMQIGWYLILHRKKRNRKELYYFLTPLFFFLPWLLIVIKVKGIAAESFWIEKPSLATFIQLPGIIFTGFENGLRFYRK
ncbi:glycosyltransferase family 39 protein, partial [Candidatus Roizmanbacteria bacterium]|nr:glycosyltransferase family 39 protein [Candidatus Roizmanbacteria bacterium]